LSHIAGDLEAIPPQGEQHELDVGRIVFHHQNPQFRSGLAGLIRRDAVLGNRRPIARRNLDALAGFRSNVK
jgi:hypothetical protein